MKHREQVRIRLLICFSEMAGVGTAMPEDEKQALLDWEAKNLDGCTVGTSDWPGWRKYIGPRPVYSDEDRAKDESGFVYLVRVDPGYCKIGRTQNVNARVRSFATLAPFDFHLIHSFPARPFWTAERKLQKRFSAKRLKGEWYRLDQADVESICRISKYANDEFVE